MTERDKLASTVATNSSVKSITHILARFLHQPNIRGGIKTAQSCWFLPQAAFRTKFPEAAMFGTPLSVLPQEPSPLPGSAVPLLEQIPTPTGRIVLN